MFPNKFLLGLFLMLISVGKSQAQLKIGQTAPEIFITDWIQNAPSSKNLKGKFVIVDFWATWCAPCLGSVPHINNLVKKNKHRPGLIFLSLTNENTKKVKWLLKQVHFSSVVATDTTGQTMDDYKIDFIPRCVVIDDKNTIRWIGDPSDLTDEVIDKIIKGDVVHSPDGHKTYLSADIRQLYDSLSRRYGGYLDDNDLKEYFSMGPITHRRRGATYTIAGDNHPYNEFVIGDSLIRRLSSTLKVADKQVLLPHDIENYCISYCYKSSVKNTPKDVMDTILHHLHLKYTIRDSLMDIIQLEVVDQKVFNKFVSDSVAHLQHSSSSETYSAISHDYFWGLVRGIQDKFQKVVVLKDKDAFDKKMDMTIRIDNIENLRKSLKAYGIKTTLVQKRLPVYQFESLP